MPLIQNQQTIPNNTKESKMFSYTIADQYIVLSIIKKLKSHPKEIKN